LEGGEERELVDEDKVIEIALRKAYLNDLIDPCLKENEVTVNDEGKAVESEKLKRQTSLYCYIVDFLNMLADVKVQLWREKRIKKD
jgi:hypothetical protein